ncbi:hypothetical protein [Luteimonas vadosa]|uniref:Branched chain amino acid aminotransferase n=1 Tax=Luteimonas vadosa TaxID=1165507 RepID=A0ABP9DZU3_9GAMM
MRATAQPLRIAMWSGPRNISTAMMRAWANRPDCAVSDEPLYAHYLSATGADHPGRDEVIAAGDCDWRRVVDALANGPAPGERPIWYQKHMTHHLLPGMDLSWIGRLHNVLLIRDPAQVVASYLRTRDTVSPEDIGSPQQALLFERLSADGIPPPVIDSGEFLRDPESHLRALCEELGIDFLADMLSWPPGPRESDGVWAPYWYDAVLSSTGFGPPARRSVGLTGDAAAVAEACRPDYEKLFAARMLV